MIHSIKPKFEVPFNGDMALLDVISELSEHIEMVYGRAEDGYPQGRNTRKLKPISLDEIEKVASFFQERGIRFNYILNGNCHGNHEFEQVYRQKFVYFIKGIKERGINIITLGNPFLIELVKQEVPGMMIAASVLLEVDNLARLKQISRTGIDYICLSKTILKNFGALENVADNMPPNVRPILLANDPCLQSCAYTQYHNNLLSHFSTEGGEYVNYCRLHCTQDFASDPRKVISASFIRPEDIKEYVSLGYELFKLCDRKQTTTWISNMLQAYVLGKYEGNLSDLMAPWSNVKGKYSLPHHISEEEVLMGGFDNIRPNLRFSPKINNRAMDDYLSFWKENKPQGCENEDCDACNYCLHVAKRAYTSEAGWNDTIIKNLDVAQKTARRIDSK
ncbi:MAG: hypothetical protein AABX04_04710 [Nanoarchaeota archaeon]